MASATLRRRLALVLCLGALGCEERGTLFQRDVLLHARNGLMAEQSASVDAVLGELFGTPDEPRLPDDLPRLAELVDIDTLQQAAGPVESHTPGVTHGLFRRHCARCHGVTGDGRGPTSVYQDPYPRDYRRGVFKWKSTYRDAPPTAADLDRAIEHGVPGTAMPSFRLLTDEERVTLRQYVVYLAMRGQTERELVAFVADELPAGEPLAWEGELKDELTADLLAPIVDAWADGNSLVVDAAPISDDVTLGRELYHSERAGCYKCHGKEGQGGAVAGEDYEVDYDLWTRERVVGSANESVASLLERDLPPLPSRPRGLAGGTLHGGAEWADLFRRVHQGVAGTPMPAVGPTAPGGAGTLADDEVAAIAAYVTTLMDPLPFSEAP